MLGEVHPQLPVLFQGEAVRRRCPRYRLKPIFCHAIIWLSCRRSGSCRRSVPVKGHEGIRSAAVMGHTGLCSGPIVGRGVRFLA